MITLFRRIRERLIASGSLTKYLLYAIGEILLVVVGILIALQVNNWNEDRKERNLARSILAQIEAKVAVDTTVIKSQIQQFETKIETANWVKEQFAADAPYSEQMEEALALISTFGVTEADYTAYNYLENVGIGIIKPQELRDQVSFYYSTSAFIAEVDRHFELNKYFRQTIYPKYFESYRYGSEAVPVNFEELKTNTEFKVAVDIVLNDAMYYQIMLTRQYNRAEELLSAINTYLETNK